MVLNVGIISAWVLYKNRPGAQTRLQKLQRKLKQKPISQKVLYSYPVKKLFSIIMILCFMIGMVLFLNECRSQLNIKHEGLIYEHGQNTHNEMHYIFPYRPMAFLGTEKIQHHQNSTIFNSIKDYNQYKKVSTTVFWMLIFFTIPLLILVCSLDFQKIIIKTRQITDPSEISGHIEKQRLGFGFIWTTTNNYLCKGSDTLCIEQCGESRFSNTTFYYAIKKISKQQQNENTLNSDSLVVESVSEIKEEVITNKGSIYQARQTLIYICHIFKKEADLRIKNGPLKEKKAKTLIKKKKQTKEA